MAKSKMQLATELLTSLFKNGKGKKYLEKYGDDIVFGMIYDSLGGNTKDAHATEDTKALIDAATTVKNKKLTKAEKEELAVKNKRIKAANKRLDTPGSYDKETKAYVLQDIIFPLLSGAVRTGGQAVAAQMQIPATIAKAVADKQNIDPRVAQGSLAAQMQSGMLSGLASGSQGIANAKSIIASGLGNTVADTTDHATNVLRAQDNSDRTNQRIRDEQIASGRDLPASYYDLQNKLATIQDKRAASGGY